MLGQKKPREILAGKIFPTAGYPIFSSLDENGVFDVNAKCPSLYGEFVSSLDIGRLEERSELPKIFCASTFFGFEERPVRPFPMK